MFSGTLYKSLFFALVIVAVIFEVIADIFFKKWSLGGKNGILYFGLLIYIIGTTFWAVSLKYENLSKAGSVFTLLNLIGLTLAGVVLFNDNLSLLNKIGIVLGMVSIALIEIF